MRSNQLSYPAIAETECKDNRNFRSCKIFSRENGRKTSVRAFGTDFASVPVVRGHAVRAFKFDRMNNEQNRLAHAPARFVCLRNALEALAVIAGAVLLAALSWEIIGGPGSHFSPIYLGIQFVVCLLFLLDFFVEWAAAERKGRYFWRNVLFLLISIPWLNLLDWGGIEVTRDWGMVVGLMPILRAFLAMVIIVRWLVRGNKMRRLLAAYVFTVVVFTYISGLVFFEYEAAVNPKLHGFGNALWWAWMNVTTVGAEIFPVTAIGKVFCIMLPSLGMMFFPIFTTYVLQKYTHKKEADR